MRVLVAAELLKLRLTRSTWALLGVAVVLGALRSAMVLLSVGRAAGVERGSAEATMTMAGAAGVGALLFLMMAVRCLTGEYRHGTMTGSLLLVADRRRLVVGGKGLAMSVVSIVLGLVLLALGLGGALLSGVGGAVSLGQVAQLVLAVVALGLFWSWLGIGIGLLVRQQTLAVLVPIVWLIVVEPLVASNGLASVLPWFPAQLPGQVLPSAAGGPDPVVAVLLLCAYAAALVVPGTSRLTRRDQT